MPSQVALPKLHMLACQEEYEYLLPNPRVCWSTGPTRLGPHPTLAGLTSNPFDSLYQPQTEAVLPLKSTLVPHKVLRFRLELEGCHGADALDLRDYVYGCQFYFQ